MTIDKILNISNHIENELSDRYNEYGLTIHQADLLLHLYKSGSDEIMASKVLNELSIDKRLLSLSLKSLEQKNYIIRHQSDTDKRQKNIELSLGAIEICEDLFAIKEEVNDMFELELSSKTLNAINEIDTTI